MTEPNWRDKYRASLAEQERQDQQLAQLRRLLQRLSLAADGIDPQLDRALKGIREVLRGGGKLGPAQQQLEQALLAMDERREARAGDVLAALERLVAQLREQPLPKKLRRTLKGFQRELAGSQVQLEQQAQRLRQLAALQGEALHALAKPAPRGSWWRRWLGNTNADEPVDSGERPAGADHGSEREAAPASAPQTPSSEPEPERRELELAGGVRPADGDGFVALSEQVAGVLNQLLGQLPVPEALVTAVRDTRQQLTQGLTLEQLVPTLDLVRDLAVAAFRAETRAFGEFLLALNAQLADIRSVLAASGDAQQQLDAAGAQLDREMRDGVGALAASLDAAGDLEQLKGAVRDHLHTIRASLAQFQQVRATQENSLSARLVQLTDQVAAMEQQAQRAQSDLAVARRKALRDPLTELPNREAWDERADHEVQRWQRYRAPLTVAVLDLDHFKQINDRFGHLAGDRVLKMVARVLRQRLRETDFLARYGGEEFVLLLPETAAPEAVPVLEALRSACADCPFHFRDQPVPVTLSCGYTELQEGDSLVSAFARADDALYQAKDAGRNRLARG